MAKKSHFPSAEDPSAALRKLFSLTALALVWLLAFGPGAFVQLACAAERKSALMVKVNHVIDGDSLVVIENGRKLEIRLWGIDAPEYDQPNSRESKSALVQMVRDRTGQLYMKYKDRYGRYVAVLEIDGLNVNQELVRGGHVWVYDRYCTEKICEHWRLLQEDARSKDSGLWGGNNPEPPWQWKARR